MSSAIESVKNGEVACGIKSQHSSRKLFRLPYTPRCPYTHSELIAVAKEIDPSQVGDLCLTIPMVLTPENGEVLSELKICENGGIYTLTVINSANNIGIIIEDLLFKFAASARLATSPYMVVETVDKRPTIIVDHTIRGRRRVPLETVPLSIMLPAAESYSIEEVAAVILKNSTTPKLDLVNIYERLYFSWAVGDTQFGTDRIKFVRSLDGFLTLAPLAHLTSSSLLRTAQEGREVSLSVNGNHEDLTSDDFVESMVSCGLERKIADNIIFKFSSLVDTLCDLIEESQLSEELSEELKFMLFIKLT